MPDITQYDAPGNLGLQPTEIGVESTAAAARRSGAFFHEAAQDITRTGERYGSAIRDAGNAAVKFAEHREISAGAAHFSSIQAASDQQWNQTAKNADPNDPSVAAQFRTEQLDPVLDKFRESFVTEGGRAWAEHHVDQYRQHMFTKTSADMSSRAADAVHTNMAQTFNMQSARVYNDPSSLDDALSTAKGAIDGVADSSPNLTAVANAKVKNDLWLKGQEQLVKTAAQGAIAKGGDWRAIADKYPQFIVKSEMAQFEKQERFQQRATILQEKQIADWQHQQRTREADGALGKAWDDNVQVNPDGTIAINPGYADALKKVQSQYSDVATPRTEAMLNWGQHQQRTRHEAVNDDPATVADLQTRMGSATNATTEVEILNSAVNGKLSSHTTAMLRDLRKSWDGIGPQGPLWNSTLDAIKEKVGFSTVYDGHERYNNFMQKFMPEYLKLKASNQLLPNWNSVSDPNSLVSKAMEGQVPSETEKFLGHMGKRFGGLDMSNPGALLQGLRTGGTTPAAPAAANTNMPIIPPALRGIAALSWSPSKGRFYDQTTGKAYNPDGSEAK